MAQFNPKHPQVEAHPVAHLILDSVCDWTSLPEYVVRAYHENRLVFERRKIVVFKKEPSSQESFPQKADWDDWLVNINGVPAVMTNELFLQLFQPSQQ